MKQIFTWLYAFVEHPITRVAERGLYHIFFLPTLLIAFVFLVVEWLNSPLLDTLGITWEQFHRFAYETLFVLIWAGGASGVVRYARWRFHSAKRMLLYEGEWEMIPGVFSTVLLLSAGAFVFVPLMGRIWLLCMAALYALAYSMRAFYLLSKSGPMQRLGRKLNKWAQRETLGKKINKKIKGYMEDA